MAGKLYGIGVGPGDPELLTLKAVRTIEESDVIAVPGKDPEQTVAYQIIKEANILLDHKELLGIYMPMTKDKELLERSHREGAGILVRELEAGKKVAFLTLGDPTVYSTYMYLHRRIQNSGYETEIISGVPSFCAAAAKLDISIAEKAEQVHIIPASYQIEKALNQPGTKILMKSGRKLSEIKEKAGNARIFMVENCGMKEEHIYRDIAEIPESAGYYTLLFVKDED